MGKPLFGPGSGACTRTCPSSTCNLACHIVVFEPLFGLSGLGNILKLSKIVRYTESGPSRPITFQQSPEVASRAYKLSFPRPRFDYYKLRLELLNSQGLGFIYATQLTH